MTIPKEIEQWRTRCFLEGDPIGHLIRKFRTDTFGYTGSYVVDWSLLHTSKPTESQLGYKWLNRWRREVKTPNFYKHVLQGVVDAGFSPCLERLASLWKKTITINLELEWDNKIRPIVYTSNGSEQDARQILLFVSGMLRHHFSYLVPYGRISLYQQWLDSIYRYKQLCQVLTRSHEIRQRTHQSH